MAAKFPYPHKRDQTAHCFAFYKLMSDTAAAMGSTSILLDWVSDARFECIMAGGETLKVQGLVRGGTNASFVDLVPVLESSGIQPAAPTALVTGVYRLPKNTYGHHSVLKFIKSAGVQACIITVVVALANQGKLGQ